ncbi:MAG: hypothetical protein WA960_02345 [Tunicatimonas sp.]
MITLLNATVTPSSDGFTGVVNSTDDHVIYFLFTEIDQFAALYQRCGRILESDLVNEVDADAVEAQFLLCPEGVDYISFYLRPISEYFTCQGYRMVVAGQHGHYAAYHLGTGATPLQGFHESSLRAKQVARRRMQAKKGKLAHAIKELIAVNELQTNSAPLITNLKSSDATS